MYVKSNSHEGQSGCMEALLTGEEQLSLVHLHCTKPADKTTESLYVGQYLDHQSKAPVKVKITVVQTSEDGIE